MRRWQKVVALCMLGFIVLLALLSLDDPTMEVPAQNDTVAVEP